MCPVHFRAKKSLPWIGLTIRGLLFLVKGNLVDGSLKTVLIIWSRSIKVTPKDRTILEVETNNSSPCPSKPEVHHPDDGKLCSGSDPAYNHWVLALPLHCQFASESLQIRWVLHMQDTFCRAYQWWKGSPDFFSQSLVLGFLCLSCSVWDCLPREVGLLVTRCVCIYDALIKQCHLITLPNAANHPVGL